MNAPVDDQVETAQAEAPQVETSQPEAPQLETLESESSVAANDVAPAEAAPTEEERSNTAKDLTVQQPDFTEVPVTASKTGTAMEHLHDVPVEVSAELGRVSMTIGELLRIGEGAVIKLNRQISAPVELVAQGVRVAMADVVVVDDCFAVRIRSVERSR